MGGSAPSRTYNLACPPLSICFTLGHDLGRQNRSSVAYLVNAYHPSSRTLRHTCAHITLLPHPQYPRLVLLVLPRQTLQGKGLAHQLHGKHRYPRLTSIWTTRSIYHQRLLICTTACLEDLLNSKGSTHHPHHQPLHMNLTTLIDHIHR